MSKEYSYGVCPYLIHEDNVYIMLIQPKGHKEYGFSKGKIELGETIEDCAIRELFEETGIIVKEEHLENYFEQKNRRKDIGVFLVDINNLDLNNKLNLRSSECFKIKFFNILDEIPINNNQKIILSQIKEFFSSSVLKNSNV